MSVVYECRPFRTSNACTHTHIYIYIYICIGKDPFNCYIDVSLILQRQHGYIHTLTHTLTHILIYSYTHILMYSYTHILIYSHTHTLMYSYSYTHILIGHMSTHSLSQLTPRQSSALEPPIKVRMYVCV